MNWERYKKFLFFDKKTQFFLDISCMDFAEDYFEKIKPRMEKAYADMDALERGSIANPEENRMVGHYWLRNPELAPNVKIKIQIQENLSKIKEFSQSIHEGTCLSQKGERFESMLIIGIGGSALGPELVTHALGTKGIAQNTFLFNNVDPDGMEKTLVAIGPLSRNLTVVISKSGTTKETRNGYLVAEAAYQKQGLNFAKHAVAITGENSELDKVAKEQGWLARFPMWDWVGGRTSQMSAVGLVPASIQGIDIDALLAGAREMDEMTRRKDTFQNPAALLALMWLYAVEQKKKHTMVILPYKDRLEIFSRYLQQLVMESLGKGETLDGKPVEEGIVVFGNKGSTDQHAYVQQLRDGLNQFFVTFIEVLQDKSPFARRYTPLDVFRFQPEPGITCGDYLEGFYLGTRKALTEKKRESISITIHEFSPHSLGMLIALFERAVGFYAFLANINAYHQPGVEAGKKAASEALKLQKQMLETLKSAQNPLSVEEIAQKIGSHDLQTMFKILRRLAANAVVKIQEGNTIFNDRYSILS